METRDARRKSVRLELVSKSEGLYSHTPTLCYPSVMLPFAVPEMRCSLSTSPHFDRGTSLFARCIRRRRRSQTATTGFEWTLSR